MGEANFYYFTCLKNYPIDSSLRSWRRHSLPLRWRFCALSSSLPAPFLAVTPVPSIWTTVRRVFPAMRWSPVLRRRRGLAKKATAGCRNVFAPERRRRKICPRKKCRSLSCSRSTTASIPTCTTCTRSCFVPNEWNDYWLTKKLYAEGHEIADHSITHESTSAFKNADIDRWTKEICGMKKVLEIFGQIRAKDVKGFRAPYLQPGGDVMFEAMARCGMLYDTSLPAAENNPPIWPYTLNHKSTQECKIGPCPKNSHPGLWEVPMVYYQDEQKPPSVCAMIDACHDNGTKQSAYDLLLNNFLRHYLTNRAPFPMFMHAGWFTTSSYRWEALNDFIDTVLAQPDVFFVTATDVIEWMKNPVQCEDGVNHENKRTCKLEGLNDWSCNSKRVMSRSEVCPESRRKSCVLSRVVYNNTCERRFSTCFRCPSTYPWLGNPDGNLFDDMDVPIPSSERSLWSPPRGIRLVKPKKEVKKPKEFTAQDARKRLLELLRKKLKDNNTNRLIMENVFATNQDRKDNF